ncbi:MAG TPA: MOSC N-terminal beta barrel domain-containing protein [Ohtaekwangia sp.]|nr:MOSC N-terminal beta barrel domain-containing protein [Ohtaekwangia sp.]
MSSVLTLSEIYIYPVKSLGGIRLTNAQMRSKGLEFDRRWMLIDGEGKFMTQRTTPELALFRLQLNQKYFNITFGGHSIQLTTESTSTSGTIKTKVWDDDVIVNEVSRVHSEWFSDMLKTQCKLVHFPEENTRPVESKFQVNNEHVSLADAFPFLIIGQASLDDLNSRLTTPLPINRFRPNFVITGGAPYEEDTWKSFKIGSNEFMGTKPCARCNIPTIDQDTIQRSAEPSKTLATYRKKNNKILFGQNAISLTTGEIKEGDHVSVLGYQ